MNLIIFPLFIHFSLIVLTVTIKSDDPDLHRSAVEIIESRGFIAQVHQVITQDNYQLIVHRIVNPLCPKGEPILLQHGLLSSSIDFVINSPGGDLINLSINNNYQRDSFKYRSNIRNQQLNSTIIGNNIGFVLALLCYDVWLGNSRGNIYSVNHQQLTQEDDDFWKFSFDEMAKYDLPAFIDHILKTTGYSKLSYIGFSQGTTQMFALLSTNTSYSSIIKPFIAMAPVTTVGHIKSPLVRAAAETPLVKNYLRSKGGPFIIPDSTFQFLAKTFCHSKLDVACLNIVFILTGYDTKEMNQSRLQVYFEHTPAGTSNWAIAHYLQMVSSGKFRKMDFGKQMNLIKYGQPFPPDYPIEMINSKDIILFSGLGDWLADQKDIQLLKSRLKVPLKDDYIVPVPHWNHIDFLWAKDLGQLVNSRIIDILGQYWP